MIHAFSGPVIYLSFIGILAAWVGYIKKPELPEKISNQFSIAHKVLVNKYYFDHFYEKVIAKNTAKLGSVFWNFGDIKIIDDFLVNGTAIRIQKLSTISKKDADRIYIPLCLDDGDRPVVIACLGNYQIMRV